MANLTIKMFKSKEFAFFFTSIIINLYIFYINFEQIQAKGLEDFMLNTNVICLCVNNLFIYYSFKRVQYIKGIQPYTLIRLKYDRYFKYILFNSIINIILYFILTYLIGIAIWFIYIYDVKLLILYLIINIILIGIYEVIYLIIIFSESEKISRIIIIPIIINFVFHFLIRPMILGDFFW